MNIVLQLRVILVISFPFDRVDLRDLFCLYFVNQKKKKRNKKLWKNRTTETELEPKILVI